MKRPKKEIKYLFNLLEKFLTNKIEELHKKGIKLKIIGTKNFSKKLNELLKKSEKKTQKNKKLQINLALNYGSKNELISAFKNLQKNNDYISEKNLSKYLLTKNIPDPDILIRTGNTKRLSNFLLWQLAYTEIFFEKKLWPDFNENDYNRIIKNLRMLKKFWKYMMNMELQKRLLSSLIMLPTALFLILKGSIFFTFFFFVVFIATIKEWLDMCKKIN